MCERTHKEVTLRDGRRDSSNSNSYLSSGGSINISSREDTLGEAMSQTLGMMVRTLCKRGHMEITL